MAKIREDFVGVVHTYVDGESVFLPAGADVPKGAEVDGRYLVEEAGGGAEEAGDGVATEYPGDGASRSEIDAYAASLGMDPSEFSNKGDLIEAIKSR